MTDAPSSSFLTSARALLDQHKAEVETECRRINTRIQEHRDAIADLEAEKKALWDEVKEVEARLTGRIPRTIPEESPNPNGKWTGEWKVTGEGTGAKLLFQAITGDWLEKKGRKTEHQKAALAAAQGTFDSTGD